MKSRFVVAAALLCVGATPPTPAAPPTPANEVKVASSWTDAVLARAGDESVLLMRQADGTVVGRTPSGRISQPLVANAPRELLFDAALNLLWMKAGDRLDVVDLRARVPLAIPIARGLPASVRVTISASWVGHPPAVYPRTGCEVDSLVEVSWLDPPKLVFEGEKPRKKGRLVGTAWLQANFDRSSNEVPPFIDFANNGNTPGVTLPAGVGKCETESDCGKWLSFGSTGRRIVLTASKTVDRCRAYSCLLFDPKSRTFSSLLEPQREVTGKKGEIVTTSSCGPVAFDSRGLSYLVGSRLCSVREGCRDLGGDTIGWLRPGQSLGPEG